MSGLVNFKVLELYHYCSAAPRTLRHIMQKVILKRKIAQRIANGHPWIFGNEVEKVEGDVAAGEIVEVYFFDGKFAGRGYYNAQSQIIVRLLSQDKKIEIDGLFFLKKIKECWAYRQQLGYTENCRLVFGEADGLPQLIIDKFNDYFVLQTLALGMDKWKTAIVSALQTVFSLKETMYPFGNLKACSNKKVFYQHPLIQKFKLLKTG